MAQPRQPWHRLDILYQRKIKEANQAKEAWKKQDNDDTENMMICASALLRAGDYAFSNSSRVECLQDAKEMLEELLKIDSGNHYAKYDLGMACYRLCLQESVTDKDREELYLKAINCFKEAQTTLPADSERMLSCMSDWFPPDQRLFCKLSDLEPTDGPVFDIERSALYGHIQALKDAERESVEDPKNPQVLKRLGTAFMGIARFVKNQDEKEMFFTVAFKAVSQLSDLEPTDSLVFDIERSALYRHIQAFKDAERESVEDPENPQILKRWGTAFMGIARSVEDIDEKKLFLAGAMKKFYAVYSKTNDKEARYEYVKAYLEITPRKGDEDVHYDQLLKEYYDFLKYKVPIHEYKVLEDEMRETCHI